ncbi:hypothetical protein GYB22_07620 [bacterium]|nr:hypothetical protein [bacterium]
MIKNYILITILGLFTWSSCNTASNDSDKDVTVEADKKDSSSVSKVDSDLPAGFKKKEPDFKTFDLKNGFVMKVRQPKGYNELTDLDINALMQNIGVDPKSPGPKPVICGFRKDQRNNIIIVRENSGLAIATERDIAAKLAQGQEALIQSYENMKLPVDYEKSTSSIDGKPFELLTIKLYESETREKVILHQKFYNGFLGNSMVTITVNYETIAANFALGGVLKTAKILRK